MRVAVVNKNLLEKNKIEKHQLGLYTKFEGGLPEAIVESFWSEELIIGKFCIIAKDVKFPGYGVNYVPDLANFVTVYPLELIEGALPELEELATYICENDASITTEVGNDVYIGEWAMICPGVHIGDGAIIEPGSIVNEDVPPYTIVSGAPAKVIRKRFDDELIELLEQFKWWDRSFEEIRPIMKRIYAEKDQEKIKIVLKEFLQSL